MGGAVVFTSTTCVRGFGRNTSGSQSGANSWKPIKATSAAASADVALAMLRQRWAWVVNGMTLDLAVLVATGGGTTGGSLMSLKSINGISSGDVSGGGASGSTSGACCSPENPIAVRILSQISGGGSIKPTI